MSEVFDAIVVGGGPAGSTCTSFLGREGRDVLLLDKAKFPRDKTCGDGIGAKSVKIMRELGLTNAIEKSEHGEIYGVIFSSPNGRILEIPYPSKGMKSPGYTCRRQIFDNILFENARKYATVMEQFSVNDLIMNGSKVIGVRGVDGDGKEMDFLGKVVVGADGANSAVANKVGLAKMDPKHHIVALRAYYRNVKGLSRNIELHFIESVIPGYFWIFPFESGVANVGIGMITYDMKKKNLNLKDLMAKAMNDNPLFKDRFAEAKQITEIKGWNLPLASAHRKAYGEGFVLIGDAASLIDPFTGEGVGNAMISGRLAAEVINKAIKIDNFSSDVLKEYEVNLWKELGNEIKTSYYLQRLGRFKPLLNFVINRAYKSKKVREAISGMLANEEAKKELVSPLFYLRLLFS